MTATQFADRTTSAEDASWTLFHHHPTAELAGTGKWTRRFEILESILLRRLGASADVNQRVAAAMNAIEQSEGRVRIGALAGALGCSRKHLVSLFKREVGLPPKSVARVMRFERALGKLQTGVSSSLIDLALSCGYADQAHFNRDFREYTGESPTALLADRG